MIQIFIFFILCLVFVALTSVILMSIFFFFDLFFELPYVGTSDDSIKKILDLAKIKKRETVVDLGSGDGRLLFAAAKLEAKVVGYEIHPILIALTNLRIKLRKSKNIIVKKQSLWTANLKLADVVFVYAKRKTMQKFEDFIFKNAKKGSRIIVNTNPFPTKKPVQKKGKIFLYIV